MNIQDAKSAGFEDPQAKEFKHWWGVLACSVHVCTGFPYGSESGGGYGFDGLKRQLKDLKPGVGYANAKAMIGVLSDGQLGAKKIMEENGWKCLGKQLSSHEDGTWVYLMGFNFLPEEKHGKQ